MSHLHHKVSALIDGELRGTARKRALNHLRQCSACQHEVEATMALKHRLLGMPDAEPSADLFASLETAPAVPDAGGATTTRTGRSVRRVLVGAGSVSVVVLSLAYVIGAPETSVEAAVTPPVDEASADLAGGGATSALSDPAVDALLLTLGSGAVALSTMKRAGDGATLTQTPAPGLTPVASAIGPPTGDDPAAVAALDKAALRPERIAYQLTRDVTSLGADGSTSVSVRVTHVPEQGTSYRVLGSSDTVPVFVADKDSTTLEHAAEQRVELLTDAYDVALAGHQIVDGRPTTVVSIGRDHQLVAEFWIDDVSGILLRRDLFDQGRLVRTSSVTSLRLEAGFLSHLPFEVEQPAMARIRMAAAAQLGDAGWTCPASLTAGLALTSLRTVDGSGDVMLAQYSDGLSTVSIFEQRGLLDATQLDGFEHHVVAGGDVYVHYGLPTVAVWQSDGMVYTAATDLPQQEVARLIAGLPHESSTTTDGGVLTRVGTGLARMAGFVSPVG